MLAFVSVPFHVWDMMDSIQKVSMVMIIQVWKNWKTILHLQILKGIIKHAKIGRGVIDATDHKVPAGRDVDVLTALAVNVVADIADLAVLVEIIIVVDLTVQAAIVAVLEIPTVVLQVIIPRTQEVREVHAQVVDVGGEEQLEVVALVVQVLLHLRQATHARLVLLRIVQTL